MDRHIKVRGITSSETYPSSSAGKRRTRRDQDIGVVTRSSYIQILCQPGGGSDPLFGAT
jgi:hypothetical protein